DDLHDGGHAAGAALLGAVLDDPAVAAGGLDGDPALVDVVAARLLDVDVLAGLAGPDGHQGVPVVRRGDRDRIDVLVLEHPADVLHGPGRLAAGGLDALGGRAVGAGVGVDQVGDLDALEADVLVDVVPAAAVDA